MRPMHILGRSASYGSSSSPASGGCGPGGDRSRNALFFAARGAGVSIYGLKPRFQALLRPLVGVLYRAGATANQVTSFACVVAVAVGVFLLLAHHSQAFFLLVPIWFFLRMALNAIDGMLAREFGQASTLGAYLNELTDVLSEAAPLGPCLTALTEFISAAALYLPFALLPGSSVVLIGAVIVLSILSEFAG